MTDDQSWDRRVGAVLTGTDDSIVRTGLEHYCQTRGMPMPVESRWRAVDHIDAGAATITRITADLGIGDPVECYLKTFRPSQDRWMSERLRARVERSPWLFDRVSEVARPGELGVPEVLASDVDRLSLLTLAMDGEPLGKAWRRALGPRRREEAMRVFHSTGRAIQTIETVSAGVAPPSTYLDEEKIQRAVAIVTPFLSSDGASRVKSVFGSLYRDHATEPGPSYYCHGDINHSNVLVDGERINLIDFDLTSRPEGFDIAMFLLRLEMERPVIRSWAATVSERVVDGYGRPDIREVPSYLLVRLVKLAGGVRRNAARGRRRRLARFVSTMERTLSAI